MKTLLTIAIALLLVQNADAQRKEYYTNYVSWLNLSNQGIYKTSYQGKDLVIRQYNDKGQWLGFEIIRLDEGKYLYYNHDEDAKNGLITGELAIKDTAFLTGHYFAFNNDTYEIDTVFRYQQPLVKHGKWHERTDSFTYSGSYEKGVRIGKWLKQGIIAPYIYDYRELTYRNNKVVNERQLNFLMTSNKDTIMHYLCREWHTLGKLKDLYITFREGNDKRVSLNFYNDGRCTLRNGVGRLVKEGKWSFKDGLTHLELRFKYQTFAFKLSELTEEYLELKRPDR